MNRLIDCIVESIIEFQSVYFVERLFNETVISSFTRAIYKSIKCLLLLIMFKDEQSIEDYF